MSTPEPGGIHFNQQGQQVGNQINVAGDYYATTVPQPVAPVTLAAARKRLARLPLEELPAALPAGSRLPFARNPHFVGRESDLRRLSIYGRECTIYLRPYCIIF
jgi:hypothetical protein